MMDSENSQTPAPTGDASSSSIARRRAVLRGLGSGAALAGSAVPLKALATGTRKHCFHRDTPYKKVKACVSGMHSAIASNMADDWPESPGKHCSHFRGHTNWPKDGYGNRYCKGHNGQKYLASAPYRQVFNCSGGGYNDKSIGEIMDNQYNCPQLHWITACLNATKFEYGSYTGVPFCYTPHEVVSLHNDSSRNLDALYFFQFHQENSM